MWIKRGRKTRRTLPIIDHIARDAWELIEAGEISEREFWPRVLTDWLRYHGMSSRDLAGKVNRSKRTIDGWRTVAGHRPRELFTILAGLELALGGAAECSECRLKRLRFDQAMRRWKRRPAAERQKILNRIKEKEKYVDI